ncbi:hypothetical protein QPL79_01230 [Ignisphaera sp. 4213-co]|uniref:AEC family transporter n=1 Tax=Ignisphaera cupida TaxID=3050454 RepID=A0ABD4Z4X2_9CREN|nr:hypothetical protein [Ignisphaera sp. 4213-co]MDK6027988.1 hypothetical protein [Ignisphaera sp. 4213-co]
MSLFELLIIILFMLLGYATSRIRSKFVNVFIDVLNKYLFYVAVPITIIMKIGFMHIDYQFALLIFISLLHIFLIFGISFSLIRLVAELIEAFSASLSLSMPNSGYLAIPLAIILWSNSIYVIPYMIAFNIVLPIITLFLAYITAKRGYDKKTYLKSIPVFTALIVALTIKMFLDIGYNAIVETIDFVISQSFYLSFILIGEAMGKLTVKTFRKSTKIILISFLIKYVISPLIAISLVHTILVKASENYLYVHGIILQSLMPPAVTNVILSKIFNLDDELVALLLVLLTPISIAISIALGATILPRLV